jgi:hypothetical protein
MNIKKKNIITLSIVTALVIAAGVGGVILSKDDTEAATNTQKKSDAPESMFEFTGAEGWRKGPSNATSMALFNSTKRSEKNPCFTSSEYWKGTVNAAAKIQESRQDLIDDGYGVTSLDTKVLTIETASGVKQYELYQSKIATPEGAKKIQEGKAIGYLQLSDGYLKIYGICDTAEELPRIFPALEAIKAPGIN